MLYIAGENQHNSMNYKPVGTEILLKKPKIAQKTKSGIDKGERTVAEEAAAWDGSMEIIAVGSESKYEALIGKFVFVRNGSPYDKIPLPNDDFEYVQFSEYNILGILDIPVTSPVADLINTNPII